jgi:hypothetical protein
MYASAHGGRKPASALLITAALLAVLGNMIQAAEPAEKPLFLDPAQPAEKRAQDLIARLTLEEKAMLLNHKGSTVERFGIKCDRWNQCLPFHRGVKYPTQARGICREFSGLGNPRPSRLGSLRYARMATSVPERRRARFQSLRSIGCTAGRFTKVPGVTTRERP